jgi:hypothetical protein
MKILFDYMSKEITNLKAEKEEYKTKYLARKEVSNSLSTQINEHHSLVTESSLVKELQAEIRGRHHLYILSIDRRDLIIHEYEQRVIQLKQQAAGEVARQVDLRLRRILEERASALPWRELTVSDCPDNVGIYLERSLLSLSTTPKTPIKTQDGINNQDPVGQGLLLSALLPPRRRRPRGTSSSPCDCKISHLRRTFYNKFAD